jgi:hypothetical protein
MFGKPRPEIPANVSIGGVAQVEHSRGGHEVGKGL